VYGQTSEQQTMANESRNHVSMTKFDWKNYHGILGPAFSPDPGVDTSRRTRLALCTTMLVRRWSFSRNQERGLVGGL
jgi:hypothetical protein